MANALGPRVRLSFLLAVNACSALNEQMPPQVHSRKCAACARPMNTSEKAVDEMAGKTHLDSVYDNIRCGRYGHAVREDFASGCAGCGPCGLYDSESGEPCPDPYEPCGAASH